MVRNIACPVIQICKLMIKKKSKPHKLCKILKINIKNKTEKEIEDKVWKAFCDLPISSSFETLVQLPKKDVIYFALLKGQIEGIQKCLKVISKKI